MARLHYVLILGVVLVGTALSLPLPQRMLGMYVLLADDTVPGYGSNDKWQPMLVDSVPK